MAGLFAIIDVETTGGSARFERITEIAIVLHDGVRELDRFSTLLNPERSIPYNITMLTGITNEMTATAPRFFEVARQIVEMTDGAVFVAHNARFDYSFVQEEFARLGYPYKRQTLCTVKLARKAMPGLPSYSLSNLKKQLGIIAERSHRALDDTLATAQLFERIFAMDEGPRLIQSMARQSIKEMKLPEGLSAERLNEAPEACGVYYLHASDGGVLYVGKSLNIRKRIYEHFSDNSAKGQKLRAGVADFSYTVTGSELAALLIESGEIKRLQPPVNRARRARSFAGKVYAHTDEAGYLRFSCVKPPNQSFKMVRPLREYSKADHAVAHLSKLCDTNELCLYLCGIAPHKSPCFNYHVGKCSGACIGLESPEDYNERAHRALATLKKGLEGTFLIVDPAAPAGNTQTVFGVRQGAYQGMATLDCDEAPRPDEIWDYLKNPYPYDPDIPAIICGYLQSGKRRCQVIRF
ncbi:MAG: exonuclease domain-containing protein [Saprospiraceae bacterium]